MVERSTSSPPAAQQGRLARAKAMCYKRAAPRRASFLYARKQMNRLYEELLARLTLCLALPRTLARFVSLCLGRSRLVGDQLHGRRSRVEDTRYAHAQAPPKGRFHW